MMIDVSTVLKSWSLDVTGTAAFGLQAGAANHASSWAWCQRLIATKSWSQESISPSQNRLETCSLETGKCDFDLHSIASRSMLCATQLTH